MKTTKIIRVLGLVFCVAGVASAQVFNSGSSGALGNVVISSDTVWNIPNDGKFQVNTLVVDPGATLSFRKPTNGLNPPVYILSRSNVTIEGTISVDGQNGGPSLSFSEGGPGGFNGGGAGIPPATGAGDGQGPGRGTAYMGGSYGTSGVIPYGSGPTYGNLLLFPLIGGSGGGGSDANPGASGGGGGGALLIASDTQITLLGSLSAAGGAGVASTGDGGRFSGPGSGGGVRMVAPVITGTGWINVSGGAYHNFGNPYGGGSGRARLDCLPQPIAITVVGTWGQTPSWRIGRNPVIFPTNAPRLDIISAAGTSIPAGTNSAVMVTLPVGSSSNQVVTLKASNFTGSFDVHVDATPENGASSRTNFVWNVGTTNMATTNVTVNIPGSIPTRITAWAEVLY